jgi:hypothetical protein
MPLEPLNVIPAALVQALASPGDYRTHAESLLASSRQLDGYLSLAISAEPTSYGEIYRYDAALYDRRAGHPLFVKIRKEKEEIEQKFRLLFDVAELTDHICHMATNFLPMVDRKPRTIASVSPEPERQVRYHNIERGGFPMSLACYLGLSPFPVFGVNIDYARPEAVDAFGAFGFGVFTYLNLVLNPNVVWAGGLPASFDHESLERPVVHARILRDTDGSILIIPPALSI